MLTKGRKKTITKIINTMNFAVLLTIRCFETVNAITLPLILSFRIDHEAAKLDEYNSNDQNENEQYP